MCENPESNLLTPRTMFEYDNHTNIPWNDPSYNPVREYLDPARQILQRVYATQEKGKKDTRHLTRRGFYMDYHVKVVKGYPAPSTYNLRDPWDQAENKKEGDARKIDPKLSKHTYLDRIEIEEKNRKKPAPGSYNLNKTDSEIKAEHEKLSTKKINHGKKRYFFEQFEFLGGQHPGPGAENPHFSVDHIKLNKTDHKFWIKKHDKQQKYWLKKRSSEPGPMSYSPIPQQFNSFIKTQRNQKSKKKRQAKSGFGTDAKFTYDRPSKKKIVEQRPTPASYKLQIEWKGKNMDSRKNNWIRSRSTGFSESVYN